MKPVRDETLVSRSVTYRAQALRHLADTGPDEFAASSAWEWNTATCVLFAFAVYWQSA
jgi:hypothetical protein